MYAGFYLFYISTCSLSEWKAFIKLQKSNKNFNKIWRAHPDYELYLSKWGMNDSDCTRTFGPYFKEVLIKCVYNSFEFL